MANEQPNPDGALGAEIQRVRDEIAALSRRKQALTASLLSNRTLTSALEATAAASRAERTRLASLVSAQDADDQLQAHRFLSAVTVFDPRAPDLDTAAPAVPATEDADLLGLRFERFSQTGGGFVAPAHVVLAAGPADGRGGQALADMDADAVLARPWRVLRHDVPAWAGVEELESRFLGPGSGEDDRDEGSTRRQDLLAFVREIQGELAAGLRRHEAVERLSAKLPDGWSAVRVAASDGREVVVEWEDGRVGKLQIDKQGIIVAAAVMDRESREDGVTKAELLRKGHIDALQSSG